MLLKTERTETPPATVSRTSSFTREYEQGLLRENETSQQLSETSSCQRIQTRPQRRPQRTETPQQQSGGLAAGGLNKTAERNRAATATVRLRQTAARE
jgi:hypothetical protein